MLPINSNNFIGSTIFKKSLKRDSFIGTEHSVRKTVGSTTTKYIYAGSELLFTTYENNVKITENVLSTNGQIIVGCLAEQ